MTITSRSSFRALLSICYKSYACLSLSVETIEKTRLINYILNSFHSVSILLPKTLLQTSILASFCISDVGSATQSFHTIWVTCYRPISLLSKHSLSFERVIFKKLYKFIAPKLFTRQFGFLKGRSTIRQLLLFLTEAYYTNEKNNELYAFYPDFAKAFDTVPHHLIPTKLRRFGIGGNLLKLIHSYLIGRKQFVELNGTSSTLRVMMSGVPQGSILGPLLFLVFIDNLPNSCSESLMFFFADDWISLP